MEWLGTLIRKIFLITSWAKVQLECSDGWLTVEVIAMIWRTQSVFLCFSRGKSLLLPTISAVSVSNVGRNWQREPAGREHKEPEWFPSEFETQWGYRVGEVGMGISRACRPVIVWWCRNCLWRDWAGWRSAGRKRPKGLPFSLINRR